MKSEVRIIGGRWRGRKLPVGAGDGLRPTPDRVRETLFNWLGPRCRGAAVLDCFAGSGVLGFEALSRGAASLVAIESARPALDNLRRAATRLGAAGVEIVVGDALEYLRRPGSAFDLVFVDPPYRAPGLRGAAIERLLAGDRLADDGLIFVEWPRGESFDLPGDALHWLKRQRAGRVEFGLAGPGAGAAA